MKKIAFLLCIFVSLFASCEEEVEYEDLGVKNIMVINGSFVDGENPSCQVSRSDIIFEQIYNKISPITFLPEAEVSVDYENANYKYVVVADSAMMEAKDLKCKAGATYKLKAKAKGLDDVYSTVSIPSKPQADFKLISIDEEGRSLYRVTYELNILDDPNTEDYYQFSIYSKYMRYKYEYGVIGIDTIGGYWIDDTWIVYLDSIRGYHVVDSTLVYENLDMILHSNDPVMNWNQNQTDNNLLDTSDENEMNIFNDQLFNGQTSKIRFYIYVNANVTITHIDISSIEFELRHINKEMYMYYRTYQKVRNSDWSGSLSPYMLYCNVENGAGLIAAWSAIKKPLPSPELSKEDNDFNNIP